MPVLSTIKRFLPLMLCIPLIASGQTVFTGTVTDATTNETLIGVNVIVQGTSLGAATDIEGQYRIVGVPERTFNVKFSYVGYEPQVVEVDFSKAKNIQTNIQLKPAVIQGEEVVVTAQMRGQIAAINQQITSNTIINVVSEEKIRELPDANAAEAIGRLPGVSIIRSGGEATNIVLRGLSSKFSNITVDGIKIPATDANTRDVDLSMMSQGSLAGIELFKTLTPDKDADAIAGAVNLVTKKAPTEREIRLDIKGDYNHLMRSSKQYDVSARYAARFIDDIIGVQLQVNAEKKIRSREDIRYRYDDSKETPGLPNYDLADPYGNDYVISEFTVGFTDETRKRNGGQAIFDFNTPDSGSVKLSGVFSSTSRNYLYHNRVYPVNSGNGWDYNYRYTEQNISTINNSLQGKNYVFGLTVDWGVSYAHSKINSPYDLSYRFTETPGGYPLQAKDHPEINIVPFALNNWASAICSTSIFYKRENFDKERTVHLNVSKSYLLGYLFSGEVKAGVKHKERERWAINNEYDASYYLDKYFANANGVPKNFTGSRFEGYYLTRTPTYPTSLTDFIDYSVPTRDLIGLYKMTPLVNLDAMKVWYEINKNGLFGSIREYTYSVQAGLSDYTASEKISSAYLMNTLNIGQTAAILFGLRAEKEMDDYSASYAPGSLSRRGITANGELVDSSTTYSETIWLPNVQVTLRPTDFLTMRLAAYKALARPDYNLRLPVFGLTSAIAGIPNARPTLTIGNPRLKNTIAWNFEINTQVYSSTIGLISISGFYKVIDNLYHQMASVNLNWVNSPYRGWLTQDPAYYNSNYYMVDSLLREYGTGWENDSRFRNLISNVSDADVTFAYNSPNRSYAWGFEFEHQMNFGFLPVSWLKNVTLSYNISVTRSETNIILSRSVPDSMYQAASPPFPATWNKQFIRVPELVTRRTEDQPEFYFNASLGYDIAGFSARISVFYQDEYTRFYSFNGRRDVVVDSFSKLDLALKQRISPQIGLFLNINNLTNQQDATSQANRSLNWDLPLTAELYGTTIDFGVRVSL